MMISGSRRTLVTSGLLLGTALAALDYNVVGTALPSVVGQLGGLDLYGWVFSAYLLTSTSTVLLYGRLADLYGRKPMYLLAILLFLVGSALCGVAGSMLWLILFRGLQGLGTGGLIPITLTLFGDLYEAQERALVQGVFSLVWGISSVTGPLLGGFLVSYVSWRWVFWINIPLGLLSAVVLLASLREQVQRRADRPPPQLWSALLLILSLSAGLVGLQDLGQRGVRALGPSLLAAAVLLGLSLVLLDRRSARPIFQRAIFRERGPVVAYTSGLTVGGMLFPVGALVPLFVQGVLHGSPTQAGLALVPMSVTWTVCTFLCGVLCRTLGYRPVAVLGGALLLAGAWLLLGLPAAGGPGALYPGMSLLGAGMALSITPMTIAVQDAVPWRRRAMTTAMMLFSRNVGGTVAVTGLSILAVNRFKAALPRTPAGISRPAELLDHRRWESIPAGLLRQAQQALGDGLQAAFRVLTGLGLACLLIALAFPPLRMRPRREQRP